MFRPDTINECVIVCDRINAFEKDERFAFIRVYLSGGGDMIVLKYATSARRDADFDKLAVEINKRCL